MRVPDISGDRFTAWADRRWERLPRSVRSPYEVARWQAEVNGWKCVVVACGNRKNGMVRLAVQGVHRSKVAELTKALYDLLPPGAVSGRSGSAKPKPKPKPRHSAGHRYYR